MSAIFFCRQHSALAHRENLPEYLLTVLNELFFLFLEAKAVVWNNTGGSCNRQYSSPLTDLSAPVYHLTIRTTFWKTNQKLIVNRSLPLLYLIFLSLHTLNLALRYPCCLSKLLLFFFFLVLSLHCWKYFFEKCLEISLTPTFWSYHGKEYIDYTSHPVLTFGVEVVAPGAAISESDFDGCEHL